MSDAFKIRKSIYGYLALLALPMGMQQAVAEQAVSLDDIVVSASGFGQILADAPASISVISRQDLETRAYKDVTDAIQDLPGVVLTGSGSSQDISLRGMGAKYTKILVDGKSINSRETRPNSDNAGIEQGWLPPLEAIERIEVVRGPMSSLYGSDAMGGVINIITRTVPQQWMGNIRQEATLQYNDGAGNSRQTEAYIAGPLIDDVLGLSFQGKTYRRAEDDLSRGNEFIGGFNQNKNDSGAVKLSWSVNDQNSLIAEAGYAHQQRIATVGKTVNPNPPKGVATDNLQSYYQNRYALTHQGRWDNLTADSYVQHTRDQNKSRDMAIKQTDVRSIVNTGVANHWLSIGAEFTTESLTDETNTLAVGTNKIDRDQWALFTEDEWWLRDDLSLTAGMRLTHDENYGSHWTPRLYSVWHMNDQWTLKGGVSTGFKAPTLRQSTENWGQPTGGLGGNAVILGNSDLKPEKTTTGEVGLAWDNSNNLKTSLTVYQTEFKDMIAEEEICSGGNCPPGNYDFVRKRVNIDKATIRGVEATATWQILQPLKLTTNYTYTHSEQKSGIFKGEPLNKMPMHSINAILDWQATSQMDVWTRVNFRSKTSDYTFRTNIKKGEPSFAYFDTGLNYQWTDKLSTGLAVYNLFNKKVYTGNYSQDQLYDDGRRFWLQVSLGF